MTTHKSMLIATLYGKNDGRMRRMHRQLYEAITDGEAEYTDYWHDQAGKTFLTYFDVPATYDTAVIQLALNADDNQQAANHCWPALRALLTRYLNRASFNLMWGYSLIYQANLTTETADYETVLPTLCQTVGRLEAVDVNAETTLEPIANTVITGGQLWLLDVPLEEDGLSAKTVYLALAPANPDQNIVTEVLFGRTASLLMPDLVAHKGYHQRRQYSVDKLDEQYKTQIDELQDQTNYLLKSLPNESAPLDLKQLAQDYAHLSEATCLLDEIQISLRLQLRNYRWWHEPTSDQQNLFEYHYQWLLEGHDNLEIKLAEGRLALETTQGAVQMVQAELDRRQEIKQQWFERILTIVGVALAVPQLIDRGAAGALVYYLSLTSLSLNDTIPAHILLLTSTQLVITVLIGVIVWWLLDQRDT
ncbi:hypothetical protein QUF64_01780 [Anaerolineales bacterium HSG6]|nr:hypothetical protein [Anaerolineales bacterium HSG6]